MSKLFERKVTQRLAATPLNAAHAERGRSVSAGKEQLLIRITSTTPTGTLYPGLVQSYNAGADTYADTALVVKVKFINGYVPTTATQVLGEFEGVTNAGVAVYLVDDWAGGGGSSWTIQEVDGSPSINPGTVRFPNTSLDYPGSGTTIDVRVADSTHAGMVSLADQTLGDGSKLIQESGFVNTKQDLYRFVVQDNSDAVDGGSNPLSVGDLLTAAPAVGSGETEVAAVPRVGPQSGYVSLLGGSFYFADGGLQMYGKLTADDSSSILMGAGGLSTVVELVSTQADEGGPEFVIWPYAGSGVSGLEVRGVDNTVEIGGDFFGFTNGGGWRYACNSKNGVSGVAIAGARVEGGIVWDLGSVISSALANGYGISDLATETFEDTGLNVSIPSAGVWRITANVYGVLTATSSDVELRWKLYNTATAAFIGSMNTAVITQSPTGYYTLGFSSYFYDLTTSGATTVKVYAQVQNPGGVISDAEVGGATTKAPSTMKAERVG